MLVKFVIIMNVQAWLCHTCNPYLIEMNTWISVSCESKIYMCQLLG